jgi:hypothetical protein
MIFNDMTAVWFTPLNLFLLGVLVMGLMMGTIGVMSQRKPPR